MTMAASSYAQHHSLVVSHGDILDTSQWREILSSSTGAQAIPWGLFQQTQKWLPMKQQSGQSLFFVDLLLPSYDITQGPNMYDDVLDVKFCIALPKALEDKTSILVRDERHQ
jgi:hypothetical protein